MNASCERILSRQFFFKVRNNFVLVLECINWLNFQSRFNKYLFYFFLFIICDFSFHPDYFLKLLMYPTTVSIWVSVGNASKAPVLRGGSTSSAGIFPPTIHGILN